MAEKRRAAVSDDRRRVLFLTTHASFFVSHWIGLARALREQGFQVIAAAAADSSVASIVQQGFIFREVAFDRYGMNALREISTLFDITRLYLEVRPCLVHHFGHKPIVYGAIAARLSGVTALGTVPGLGYAYSARSARARGAKAALGVLYRLFRLINPTQLIFENSCDRQLFLDKRFIRRAQTTLISGAGVDCQEFKPHPERAGTPEVILAARMLLDKGVEEFVNAARLIARRGIAARFVLAGAAGERDRSGITERELQAWSKEGIVTWIGHRSDVPALLAHAHIVCLPSHGGDGLPRSLAEAAASGRPIVASDIPGCRAVVSDQVNGFLVPVRDSEALADRIACLLLDRELRQRMGAAGRDFAIRELSSERVIERTFDVYRKLGFGVTTATPTVGCLR